MLRKFFVTLFFGFSFSLSFTAATAATGIATTALPTTFNLGTLTVTAPSWDHPEEITGKSDGETFFEILPSTGHTTISESLDGLMGINLRSSGGAGHVAAISSGGLSGNKILVIKDGLPVNDPFTGTPDIGDFSTLQLEKAELWNGNRATLWGSSSIGGTLRLSSRFPDHGKLRSWTDGLGGNGQAFETRLQSESTKFGIRLSQFKTPGFSAAASDNGNTERDSFNLKNAYIAMETCLKTDMLLTISAESNESMTELDGFDFVSALPADNLDFRQRKLNNQFNFGLTSREKSGELRLAHIFNHTGMTGLDESNKFNEFGLETSRQKQLISRSHAIGHSSFLAELSRTETRAENHGIFVNRETDLGGVFAVEHKLSNSISANATARYDDPQNHKGVTTGNLSIIRSFDNHELSLAWGQSFRMPALNERYYPAYGDKKLEAEHSTSFGITAAGKINNLARIIISATQYLVRDLIGTTTTADPAYTWGIKAANLNRAKVVSHTLGFDDCKISGIDLSGSITLMDKARLMENGKNIPGVAGRQASLTMAGEVRQIKYQINGKWWGPVWENAENTKSTAAGHDISLFLRRSFKECSIEAGFLNLTNITRARTLGYTTPGRRLTLAIETSF